MPTAATSISWLGALGWLTRSPPPASGRLGPHQPAGGAPHPLVAAPGPGHQGLTVGYPEAWSDTSDRLRHQPLGWT